MILNEPRQKKPCFLHIIIIIIIISIFKKDNVFSMTANLPYSPLVNTDINQRTNGPVNAHLISWPIKAQNIQNLKKYMVKK